MMQFSFACRLNICYFIDENGHDDTEDTEMSQVEIEKEQFKKMFPHLAKEMEAEDENIDEHKIQINSVRSNLETKEKISDSLGTSMPDVIDFIRRCDNEKQAKEIIDYMEKRKEIPPEYARRLRRQLREKGVRSFGTKKEEGYYFKQGGFKPSQTRP
jgi:hypothetical protein